jgi:5'-deoxynucleotidase YfbR-like HD superfamily hydrolase
VSLIYLGDENASDQYIGYLLDDPRWNRINRGFHLEYYGDIPIMPGDALRHDPPAKPFPRTYQRLMEKILSGISRDRKPHFDLDVFTIYSLAQYRHLKGTVPEPIRRKLVSLAPTLMEEVRSKRLELYLGMIQGHLTLRSFHTGLVAEDLYKIKKVARQGWRKRHVRRPDSVAYHMYRAFLLAFCYLPLDDTVPGYDRDRILKMILIHDLAESKTGDIINKTDAEVRAESCWFAQTTNLSTYSDLTGIGELSELWGEFEGQSTINARIAKDFDRFDQLTQLYIYQRQVPDFVSWRKELLSGMVTEQGRRVLKVVTSHFDAG